MMKRANHNLCPSYGKQPTTVTDLHSSIKSSKVIIPHKPSLLTTQTLALPAAQPQMPIAVTPPDQSGDGTIRVPSGSGYRIMTPFPWRLHEMLEEVVEKDLGWIVSWLPGGRAFQVHSPERFADTIIPMYFRHTRYESFQRQLYLYGFRCLEMSSVSRGAYFHPIFIKENRSLCQKIVRPKATTSTSQSSTPPSRSGGSQSNPRRRDHKRKIQARKESTKSDSSSMEQSSVLVSEPSMIQKQALLDEGYASPPFNLSDTSIEDRKDVKCSPLSTFESAGKTIVEQDEATTSQTRWGNTACDGRSRQVHSPLRSLESSLIGQPLLSTSTGTDTMVWLVREARVSLTDLASVLSMKSKDWDEHKSSLLQLEPYSNDIISLFGGA